MMHCNRSQPRVKNDKNAKVQRYERALRSGQRKRNFYPPRVVQDQCTLGTTANLL